MGIREVFGVALIVIILFFIFSPLAAVSETGQPSFSSLRGMVAFYEGKFGEPDHIVKEYCVKHPFKWIKKTYIWEQEFMVVFLWRPKVGWEIIGVFVWGNKGRDV